MCVGSLGCLLRRQWGKFLANQTGDSAYVCFVRPIWVRYLGSCGWNSYPSHRDVIALITLAQTFLGALKAQSRVLQGSGQGPDSVIRFNSHGARAARFRSRKPMRRETGQASAANRPQHGRRAQLQLCSCSFDPPLSTAQHRKCVSDARKKIQPGTPMSLHLLRVLSLHGAHGAPRERLRTVGNTERKHRLAAGCTVDAAVCARMMAGMGGAEQVAGCAPA